MTADKTKKKKQLTYKGKPIYRQGNRIYYGNLEDDLILVIDIVETKKIFGREITKKVVFEIQDNTGELGKGATFRKGERDNLYKAFDMGSWWLQDALDMQQKMGQ